MPAKHSTKPARRAPRASIAAKKTKTAKKPVAPAVSAQLYSLKVFLADWRWKPRRSLWRTIQIRGHQSLHDLHQAIFDAFDRFDEHLYEFSLEPDPRGPAKRYVHPYALEPEPWGFDDRQPDQDASQTTVDSLNLNLGQQLFYLFDFGDSWHHTIEVLAIDAAPPKGKYPNIADRKGDSPPQYPDTDEE